VPISSDKAKPKGSLAKILRESAAAMCSDF